MLNKTQIDSATPVELKKSVEYFTLKEEEYKSEIRFLKEQVDYLKSKLFGRRSEKFPIDDRQMKLFGEPELPDPPADEPDEEETIPAYKRKKRGRKPIPDNLPRVDVVHDIEESKKECACGCQKSYIGDEVSEQLDIIPAKMQVIRNIRYKYACKNCEGVEDGGPTVVIADMPEHIIPKSIATSRLIAHTLTAKFVDSLPFYRQEKQFKRLGIKIPRSTMCNWVMKVADSCQILMKMFHEEILSGPLINIDETTFQVLKEPGKTAHSKSYMWVFRGGTPENPTLLYQYHPNRSSDVASAFVKGYKGIVQTDGYVGYDFLDQKKGIIHVGCLAHARRKFADVTKVLGKVKSKTKISGHAGKALKFIRKLYKIERKAKEEKLSPDEIYKLRQEKSVPILNDFKKWLDGMKEITPPQGLLGKAVAYSLNQWHRISAYVKSGIVKPDNNDVENAIRPFAVGRKNWLFNSTPAGAAASATLYSLIETAKSNDLEPSAYLSFLFENLPKAKSSADFKSLMPQYIDKSKI